MGNRTWECVHITIQDFKTMVRDGQRKLKTRSSAMSIVMWPFPVAYFYVYYGEKIIA